MLAPGRRSEDGVFVLTRRMGYVRLLPLPSFFFELVIISFLGREEMWASAWTSTCTVSPTGSNGINHLQRPLKKLGEKESATVLYTLTDFRVRLNLQSWLPTEFHKEINHLLVGFGQVCRRRLIPHRRLLRQKSF